jgi:hypothetical protein
MSSIVRWRSGLIVHVLMDTPFRFEGDTSISEQDPPICQPHPPRAATAGGGRKYGDSDFVQGRM